MLGQVNASHMGLRGGENRLDLHKDKTGLLGLTVIPLKSGNVKVKYVTRNMPGDRSVSKLKVGDVITAVNGASLSGNVNFYSLFNNTGNDKIYLNVTGVKGVKKEVVIRPKSSDRKEKYEDWVQEKKRLTDRYSNGKLGYIHIQGMNWTSFEEFERELSAAGLGKEGVVIDVRFNGGGWTTDYLMAVLTVRQHAYTVPRGAAKDLKLEQKNFKDHYPFSERLPLTSWTKPSIALCNESSYSNAEIFSHAYKNLGIGSLVGIPTFGAVISTGSKRLIDGSSVRMPFRGWYIKASQENMEFHGAVPDFIVKNNPDSKEKGEDLQLRKAVDELLSQLK
jgi:C-terminal processing protease CtpA/Prc